MLPGCPADEVLQTTAPIPRNGAPDLWTLISKLTTEKKVYFMAHAGPNPVVSRIMSAAILVGPCKSLLCPQGFSILKFNAGR
ncbi:unnamed protein product [Fusarium venenatum]|uniref:Uncharacterized protein n=1 Tax=Fusarium venenatum TaxID=56646 RepID=A0A2L2T5Z4_9HYPO|nr:uncharacterized protein FVRRES_01591 [Fusarium venenatum]CEI65079.1 unnamed protein product [Fusarium venenatum]